jgi:VanZ family protein
MTAGGEQRGSRLRLLITAWLPLLAWMALVFFLSAQPNPPHAPGPVLDLLVSSAAHFALYAVLALLAVRAFGESRRAWFAALWLTLLFAVSDELHQAFVPGRTSNAWDVACDAAGALLALWAWTRLPFAWKRHLIP